MIPALLYAIAGTLLYALNSVLALAGTIPYFTEIQNAIAWAVGSIQIFNGIFPVNTLLQCALTLLTVWILKYTVHILLFAIGFLPWFNTPKRIPSGK